MASYTYILASKKNGTIYIGVTTNLTKRVYEHKTKLTKGFTSKYNVNKLVYYEICDDVIDSIKREKQQKKWNRFKKIKLIEDHNPNWDDLAMIL